MAQSCPLDSPPGSGNARGRKEEVKIAVARSRPLDRKRSDVGFQRDLQHELTHFRGFELAGAARLELHADCLHFSCVQFGKRHVIPDVMKLQEPALWTTAACADESAVSFIPPYQRKLPEAA